MKKVVISLMVISLVLLSGCESDKEVVKHCSLNSNDTLNGYKLETDYKIISKNDVVTNVVTKEIVTSDNKQVLTYMEKYLKNTYDKTNDTYGGYDTNIEIDGDTLTSTTKIDYTKMNLKQYVKDNTSMKSYVNDNNELTLDGVIKLYEKLGAECK